MKLFKQNYQELAALPVLVFLLFPSLITAQLNLEVPSLENLELKGSVKKLEDQQWRMNGAEKEELGRVVMQFTSKGLLEVKKEFDEVQDLKEQHTFAYDERGNLMEKNHLDNSVNNANYKTVYTYNENNQILTRVNYNPDGSLAQSHKSEYDEAGRLVFEEEILHNSESSRRVDYQNDEDGNKTAEIHFSGDWPERKITFRYDQELLMEEKEYRNISEDEEWGLAYHTIYEYDDTGNEIKNVVTDYDEIEGDALYEVTEIATYANGQKIKAEKNSKQLDGEGRNREELVTYDEKGNPLMQKTVVDGKAIFDVTMRYEYDEWGNWVRKTESKDGEVQFLTEREIEYFEG